MAVPHTSRLQLLASLNHRERCQIYCTEPTEACTRLTASFPGQAGYKPAPERYKSSSGDEIANVNFLRQHRTCRGQRLRPFNEFVISTKRLHQKRYTLPTCLEMDSPVQSASASHNKWTRPSVKETHQATWAWATTVSSRRYCLLLFCPNTR